MSNIGLAFCHTPIRHLLVSTSEHIFLKIEMAVYTTAETTHAT